MRVRIMVRDIFTGESMNPGAMIFTIRGDRMIPQMETTTSIMDITQRADLASLRASSLPSLAK
jgi:hypothetical protein